MIYATPHSLVFGLSALASLLPATIYALSPRAAGDEPARAPRLFWLLGAVAFCGSVAWTVAQFALGWRTGFAPSLWLVIVVTLALYGGLAGISAEARRLAAPLYIYLSLMALPAILWSGAPERPLIGPFGAWMSLHILAAILAYALATLAAVAGVGVLLRESALKRKALHGMSLAARMPAVADGERLQSRLLLATAALLAIGLISGMAAQYVETGALLPLTHKVVLAFIAFVVVVALLALQSRMGMGGRRLARIALGAYLALAFAYPGVKFVTDVLIGGN
ncbi:MAG TPA: cytochrome c biogenesis protein CcsA [Alphaproteobacteria bacterium]|nr:cytochrome c biogenesis protein CcsA [Alphaproteobacteria bacterium]